MGGLGPSCPLDARPDRFLVSTVEHAGERPALMTRMKGAVQAVGQVLYRFIGSPFTNELTTGRLKRRQYKFSKQSVKLLAGTPYAGVLSASANTGIDSIECPLRYVFK